MRIALACGLLLMYSALWSQGMTLPEPTEGHVPAAGSAANSSSSYFCSPGIHNQSRSRGVEILYRISSGGEVLDRVNENLELAQLQAFEQLNFKLYIPLLLKRDWKILLGYTYQPERFQFRNLGTDLAPIVSNFQNTFLKSNSYSLTTSKSLNDRHYIAFRAKVAFNGDYKTWINFENRYMTMNAIGLLGFKKSEDFEWGVGVYYSKNMRRSLILPFAMMHKNFNDKWGIEIAPPAYIYGRYNIHPKTILLFGGEYNSRIYSFDTQHFDTRSMPIEYTMNHGEINTLVSMEQQIVPWIWMGVKGGYQFSIRSRLETKAIPDANRRINLPNAPFFEMSIFLSPPDHMK